MSCRTVQSAISNPAVYQCCEASNAAYDASFAKDKNEDSAQDAADFAFREALPPLKGIRNIRNFIACVTYGALMGIIDGRESSRLLYAARIAYTTRRTRKRETKPEDSSAKESHSGAIQDGFSAIQEPSSVPVEAA
jgi:hypothetical protein